MSQKITITDPIRAKACVQWLIKEIGPVTRSGGGPLINGEGWNAWLTLWPDRPILLVELDDIIDDDTQLLFILKWS